MRRSALGDGGTRCEAASCSRTCRRRYGRVCCYTRPDRYASAHAPAPSLTSVRCRASKGEVGSLDWALAPEGGSLEDTDRMQFRLPSLNKFVPVAAVVAAATAVLLWP